LGPNYKKCFIATIETFQKEFPIRNPTEAPKTKNNWKKRVTSSKKIAIFTFQALKIERDEKTSIESHVSR
jgi:hypothetical protein